MKKSKNIYYIIYSPDLNGCPPLSYLILSDMTERTFLLGGGVHVHPMHPPAYAPAGVRPSTVPLLWSVFFTEGIYGHFKYIYV